MLWVHRTLNHLLCSSLHFKFPLVRTRQVLLPPHLSFLLSMLLRFYRLLLSSFLCRITTPLPPPPLPLRLSALCDSLAAMFDVCRNVAFTAMCQQNDHSSRNHWQVRLRTAPHQIKRSPESPESQHQGRFSSADCHKIWVRCLSRSWVTAVNLARKSTQVLMSAFPVNEKSLRTAQQ